MSQKLIIIRGNSGSGKSSVAQLVREKAKSRVAIVEQDYLRRFVLKEKENKSSNNIGLIKQTVEYALDRGYNVILEGILYSRRYRGMLIQLLKRYPNHFVYYIKVSFDETLKRHNTKPNAHEFGKTEMERWYKEQDLLGAEGEVVISETSSLRQTANKILKETKI